MQMEDRGPCGGGVDGVLADVVGRDGQIGRHGRGVDRAGDRTGYDDLGHGDAFQAICAKAGAISSA